MKELPVNFGMSPGQDYHKYFHNLLIEFKKLLKKSKDISELKAEMNSLINASKTLTWKENRKHGTGEQACSKVWHEFKRYIESLEKKEPKASAQYLIEAIEEIEILLKNFEVK